MWAWWTLICIRCLFVKFLRMTISVPFWKSNQEVLDHCANWKELHWKSMTQFRRYVKLSTKVVKTKIVASSIDLINDALKRVLLNTFSFYNFQLFENQLLIFFFFFKDPALKPRTFDTFPNKRKEFPWKFHVGWFFTL